MGFILAITVLQGDTYAGSGLTSGGGYAPEPSEQDQLMEIDSKIQQLSVKEFVPPQDSSTDLSLSQVRAQSAWQHTVQCVLGHSFTVKAVQY